MAGTDRRQSAYEHARAVLGSQHPGRRGWLTHTSLILPLCSLVLLCPPRALGGAPDEDCGAYALYEACRLVGIGTDYRSLSEKVKLPDGFGTTFAKLEEAAMELGCRPEALRLSADQLLRLQSPVVAFVGRNHFVTIGARDSATRQVFIIDKRNGYQWEPIEQFCRNWNGEALVIRPTKEIDGPRLWVQADEIHLGNLVAGKVEKKAVTLINIGGKPLSIQSARASCACANAHLKRQVIPPRSFSIMEVSVDSTARCSGPLPFDLLLQTDDPHRQLRLIRMFAIVKPAVALSPSYVSLGDVPSSMDTRVVESELQVTGAPDAPPTPHEMGPGVRWIRPVRKEASRYTVGLLIDFAQVGTTETGRFSTGAVIATGHPVHPYVGIAVTGRRLPWLSVMPREVYLGRRTPGELVTAKLKVVNSGKAGVQFDIETPEWVEARMEGEWVLVRVRAPQVPGAFFTGFVVKAADEYIRIPIVGFVGNMGPARTEADGGGQHHGQSERAGD